MELKSVYSALEINDAVNYPIEILNSLNPLGFSSHLLIIKTGTPIMLLKNLSKPKLCNGTHFMLLIFKKI